MKRQYNLLLHPVFIISLFLLLLNDISLKYHFANTFTGKLSDFSGLLVFTLFWTALFPVRKNSIAFITAILFTWWKSSLSSSFIHWWNETMFFSISRVIDYSDLLALTILPVAVIIAERNSDPVAKYRRLFIPVIGCITVFSFCFTSAPRYIYSRYAADEILYDYSFKTRHTEQEILSKLREQHIFYTPDSISYYPARQYRWNADYVLRVTSPGPDSIKWIPVENKTDSSLYVRINEGRYYMIPTYRIDDIEMQNVKLFISETNGGKRSRILVERFSWNRPNEEFKGKLRRKIDRHFKALFGN